MSLFCIAVLFGVDINASLKCKDRIMQSAKEHAFGVHFDHFYCEPFLQRYKSSGNYLIFKIADNNRFENCEELLCPDWCSYQGHMPCDTLQNRLARIAKLLFSSLRYAEHIELFIGESGDELDCFYSVTCNISELCDVLIKAYNREGNVPTIHLKVYRALGR